MKKVWLVALIGLVGTSLAIGQTSVNSANAVGYVKVDIPPSGSFALVAFNFEGMAGGSVTFSELFGTSSLRQSSRSTGADRVVLFGDDQIYHTYYQSTDGLFYEVGFPGVAVNPLLAPGQGFWLIAKNGETASYTIFLKGQVVSSNQVTRIIKPGYNLLGYAFAADFDMATVDWSAVTGATGSNRSSAADKVSVWNPVAGYATYYLDGDFDWHLAGGDKVTELVVPVGSSVWYQAKKEITLDLARPYPWW